MLLVLSEIVWGGGGGGAHDCDLPDGVFFFVQQKFVIFSY